MGSSASALVMPERLISMRQSRATRAVAAGPAVPSTPPSCLRPSSCRPAACGIARPSGPRRIRQNCEARRRSNPAGLVCEKDR
jgi:hypothetical protein